MARESFRRNGAMILIALAALLFGTAGSATAAENQQPIGIVESISGTWQMQVPPAGPKPVSDSSVILSGAYLKPGAKTEENRITFLLTDGRRLTWRGTDDLSKPLLLTEEPDIIARITAALAQFNPTKSKVVSTIARTAFPLRDGIALYENGVLDLSTVSGQSTLDRYQLEKEPPGSASGSAAGISADELASGKAKIAGLERGVYRLSGYKEGDAAPAESALVLVSSPDRFKEDSAAFGKAAEIADKWEKQDADRAISQEFLRAFIMQLAR